MIKKQKEYINFTNLAIDIAKNTEFLNKKTKELEEILLGIEKQELLVPVIGGFSSGKSSLINNFLGADILGVAITPETSIATELRYDENEKIRAVKDDGSNYDFTLDKLQEVQENAQDYNHIKLFLNNEKLKNISPLVLVDMPGFNAPVATHNKAIARYMPSGCFFVALLSGADEKTIQTNFLNELSGIYSREKDFIFCISKTNLISQDDAESIAGCVKDQLEGYFNYENNIEFLDDNGGIKLNTILQKINCDKLFEKITKPSLVLASNEMESSINTVISGLKYNKDEAEKFITEMKNSIIQINKEKENSLQNIQNRYGNSSVEGILGAVRSALNSNVSMLAQTALSGENLQKDISNIVNSVLPAEIQKRLAGISKNVIDSFSINIKDMTFNQKDIKTWADGLKTFVDSACFIADNALTGGKQTRNLAVDTVATQAGTFLAKQALAKIGFVINPIVGSVLSIAFSILPSLFSKVAENKREENIREKIKSEIIPSVISQIKPEIESKLSNQIAEIIENISQAFSQKVLQKQAEIENAQNEKEKIIGDIEQQISILSDTREKLKKTMNKYL